MSTPPLEARHEAISWRSALNDPPPLDRRVLILHSTGRIALAYRTDHNGGGWVSAEIWGTRPVWWAPIPEFPVQDENEAVAQFRIVSTTAENPGTRRIDHETAVDP